MASTPKRYAVIDIETTGGRANRDRITEIAIIIDDGNQVIERFQTLLNPERSIPYNITQLTGITDEMVADAPKFYEVAKRIVELTQGAIFVAHNVNFDYSFVREEFARLGYAFNRKKLCTVRLSRQTFPGQGPYSLGALTRRFGIKLEQAHRAMDDAEACRQLLHLILSQQEEQAIDNVINKGVEASKLPPNITLEQLHGFPEACGVYFFHNKKGTVTYVGKSINIKKRLLEHFANKTEKALRMNRTVHEITYELTGGELTALLLEAQEIKKRRPVYNTAQKRTKFPYGVTHYKNEGGYICFAITDNKADENLLAEYPKASMAQSALANLARKHQLCKPLCGIENVLGGNCFNYQLQLCNGACMQKESVDAYNERAERALERLQLVFDESFLVIEPGRNLQENAVIYVENGVFQGFGFIEKQDAQRVEDLKACIRRYPNDPDISRIIKQHLKSNKDFKVVPL